MTVHPRVINKSFKLFLLNIYHTIFKENRLTFQWRGKREEKEMKQFRRYDANGGEEYTCKARCIHRKGSSCDNDSRALKSYLKKNNLYTC